MSNLSRLIRSRPLQAVAAVLAMLAVSLVAAAPRAAASEQNCNSGDRVFVACLRFDYQGYGWYNAHVGLDMTLPPQYGAEIVACGADLKASLWGDDGGGSSDDHIRDFVVTPGWPVATSTGFFADLYTLNISGTDLDEDDGEDELYARVSYWDCHTGLTRSFRTGILWGYYG
jgi:hypothetical protein